MRNVSSSGTSAILGHMVGEGSVRCALTSWMLYAPGQHPLMYMSFDPFLGMCGYYRKFVKGFSEIAAPLFDLTRMISVNMYGTYTSTFFEQLRDALLNGPTLQLPDHTKDGSCFVMHVVPA